MDKGQRIGVVGCEAYSCGSVNVALRRVVRFVRFPRVQAGKLVFIEAQILQVDTSAEIRH